MAKTTIQGTIESVAGSNPDGELRITLDAPFSIDNTDPDTYFIPEDTQIITVTAGSISVDLEPTENQGITYLFEFYKSDGAGGFLDNPSISFHAEVPDTSGGTYEFAQLAPSGITTDTLSTGALRISKEILENETLTPLVLDAFRIYRTDTEPTHQVANEIWLNSGDGTIWTYDDTIDKWQSQLLVSSGSVNDQSADGSLYIPVNPLGTYADFILERVQIRWSVANPNDASNHWEIDAGYKDFGNSSLTNNLSDRKTHLSGSDFATPGTQHAFADTEFFGMSWAKVGSPGNLNLSMHAQYRYLSS
ncbi:MAG: hypothetical protein ACFE0I_02500 [Elainellaceae cyanobacterium]